MPAFFTLIPFGLIALALLHRILRAQVDVLESVAATAVTTTANAPSSPAPPAN